MTSLRSFNGGEDDEVAAMAAAGDEEIRGEAIREEIGRVGSGERAGEGEIDGGDSVERAQGDAGVSEEAVCEKGLHKGSCGGKRRRFVGRGRVSERVLPHFLQGGRHSVLSLGDCFLSLHQCKYFK